MKKSLFAVLFLVFAGISASSAQTNSPDYMKTYDKVKDQYDKLVTKWKPYKDKAIQNSDKLSPDLKASMKNLDDQINSFGKKLDEFPKASADQQKAMAPGLKSDYTALKTSVNDVSAKIKALKLPKT